MYSEPEWVFTSPDFVLEAAWISYASSLELKFIVYVIFFT